jgi:exodeoxyribonuclease VIII
MKYRTPTQSRFANIGLIGYVCFMKLQHILSKSRLDLINRAPALYKRKYIDGIDDATESPALILGQAVHCRILEPAEFGKRFTIAPALDRRTKDGKEKWENFLQQSEGLKVLTKEQDEIIEGINHAIYQHPAASYLLGLAGDSEIMENWTDEISGLPCRGIFDRLTSNSLLIDIKTTDDASPKGFARSVVKYRYHVQTAFYMDGFKASRGTECEGFFFIAVEKAPPHLVAVYYLTAEDIERGREQYRKDIETFTACLNSNDWHGYGDGVQELNIFNYGK